ncbi:hypothetical protein CVT25_008553 [Psilocybe cyanescens]|uniref:F-box domain-containing protein n=1 Tax=Psilocybe cyanescens TaxID=93625 RepID=A0A409XDB4_PSICY|nr:hypothetical protein CVT25_008553 [Psilocybe cyanescens]
MANAVKKGSLVLTRLLLHSYTATTPDSMVRPIPSLCDVGSFAYDYSEYCGLFGRRILHRDIHPDVEARPSYMDDLPAEVLIVIFDFLSDLYYPRFPLPIQHYTKRHHERDIHACDCVRNWSPDAPTLANNLFPYAQSKVSRRWMAILGSQRRWWRKLYVSRLKGIYTPPETFQKYLEFSKNETLEIHIGGNNGDIKKYKHEADLILAYINILTPHLHRCRKIELYLQKDTPTEAFEHVLVRTTSVSVTRWDREPDSPSEIITFNLNDVLAELGLF